MSVTKWTPDHDARLRELWKDPHLKIRDMGEDLGVSAGLIGKHARNLMLPARPPCVINFDADKLARLWVDRRISTASILSGLGIKEKTARMVAAVMDLPPRDDEKKTASVRRRMKSQMRPKPGVVVRPKLAQECRHKDPIDIDILASKGRYANLAEIAARHQMGLTEVHRRFHRLRAAA